MRFPKLAPKLTNRQALPRGKLLFLDSYNETASFHENHCKPMLRHVSNSDWLFCINSFKYSSPSHPGILKEDRDFKPSSFKDIILNNNKNTHEIALSISMPLLNTLIDPTNCNKKDTVYANNAIRSYLDHLIQEISTLSQLIPQNRKVTYLHWQGDLTHLLTPAQMTELMFMLNKYFRLDTEESRRFVIEFDDIPEDDSNIALLKGLGFNRVCLGTNSTFNEQVKHLNIPMRMFRDYDFKAINLRVLLKRKVGCLALRNHLKNLIELNPDTLYLIDEDERQRVLQDKHLPCELKQENCRDCLAEMLLDAGYERVNHVKYSRTKKEPSYKIEDIIGLGLGAISLIENTFSQNHNQLDNYYSAIESSALPIATCGYISPSKQS